jgi:hypothetical protein
MCRQWSILCVAVLLLCLAGVAEAGDVILQCDAGEGALQAGWTQVLKGTNVNVAGTGINVTLATGAPTAIAARDTGGSGVLADVETDLYFADNEAESPGSDFILTLSNLTPGMPYRLLSYHNRSDEGDTTIPGVTLTGAMVIIAPSTILQSHAIMDDPAEFIFVADASTVSIRYQGPDGGCLGCQAFFNGFQLEYGSPAISFAAESSGAVEAISPAMIAVNLNNAEPGQTYTVDYRVIGGTADGGGVDYYLVEPNTLTFTPGQTSKYIVIDINSDGVQEPDETIILELSNVTGPDCVLGISEHTYTISDGPPQVSFLQAGDSGYENVGSVTIPVVLSHASDQTVTVDYEVTGGTATSGGVDYDLFEPNTMTFNPGQTSKIISIDIIDDDEQEDDETINLTLSNAHNAILSSPATHAYTIMDNEDGVRWNGTTWYYSAVPNNNLFVNPLGQLEWRPEREQYITRIPDHNLSGAGNVVEISYWWMSDGDHDCPDCFACPDGCYDDDITCIAGTSDIRVGLFEADGEYVEADGLGVSNSIFNGYKGYQFRFGPNMMAGPTRWVDCTGEVHKTGQIKKKDVSFSDLLSSNDHPTLGDLPGFELPPGEWTLFTMRLERSLDKSSVEVSMTFNGRTYSDTDGSSSGQPQKIDVLAIYMRNGRPYTRLVLDNVCEAVGGADFNGDDVVDEKDLKVVAQDWLLTGGMGPVPDANYLVVHYNFDETSGSTAYDSSSPAYNGAVQVVSSGLPKTNAWDPSGQDAGCINFDGNTKVTVASASSAFAGVSSAVTVSLWVNGNAAVQPDPAWGMAFQAGKPGEDRVLLAHIPTANNTGVMFESGGYNVQRLFWSSATESDWEGQWNHYVFTLDTVAGLARIYCNGDKKAERGATTVVSGISSFMVGNGLVGGANYEYFGRIDDSRVYSYALSPDEVLSMYSGGQLPPDSPANLYLDEIIDFKDFAAFASLWSQSCQ